MGPRRDAISNCELIVTDDTSNRFSAGFSDITLSWTNAGARTGRSLGTSDGAAAAPEVTRYKVRLTSGDDCYDQTTPIGILRGNAINLGVRPGTIGLLVLGRAGNDVILAWSGSGHLEGEAGNDTLSGRAGNDLLFGRTGDDLLLGDDGDDVLEGGRGRDRLDGAGGDDRLTGGFDRDTLRGGGARDRLVAVDGIRDIVDCGAVTTRPSWTARIACATASRSSAAKPGSQ